MGNGSGRELWTNLMYLVPSSWAAGGGGGGGDGEEQRKSFVNYNVLVAKLNSSVNPVRNRDHIQG